MQEGQAQNEIPGGEDQAVAVAVANPANATATSPPFYLGEDLINLFMESSLLQTKIDKLEDSRIEALEAKMSAHEEWSERLYSYTMALRRSSAEMEQAQDVASEASDELDQLEAAVNESEANNKAYQRRLERLEEELAIDRASLQKLLDQGTIPENQDPGNDSGTS